MSDDTLSKFLSLVLRHNPTLIGLTLGDGGWVQVDELLAALARNGRPVERAKLQQLVRESDKQRFALSPDGSLIRANQGHSVNVDLGLSATPPPDVLFHGTVARYLTSIREHGLLKGKRQHVHLSATPELAVLVGQRRGAPHVLQVDARGMASAGCVFYRSENGVWLAEHVPVRFLTNIPRAD